MRGVLVRVDVVEGALLLDPVHARADHPAGELELPIRAFGVVPVIAHRGLQ